MPGLLTADDPGSATSTLARHPVPLSFFFDPCAAVLVDETKPAQLSAVKSRRNLLKATGHERLRRLLPGARFTPVTRAASSVLN